MTQHCFTKVHGAFLASTLAIICTAEFDLTETLYAQGAAGGQGGAGGSAIGGAGGRGGQGGGGGGGSGGSRMGGCRGGGQQGGRGGSGMGGAGGAVAAGGGLRLGDLMQMTGGMQRPTLNNQQANRLVQQMRAQQQLIQQQQIMIKRLQTTIDQLNARLQKNESSGRTRTASAEPGSIAGSSSPELFFVKLRRNGAAIQLAKQTIRRWDGVSVSAA